MQGKNTNNKEFWDEQAAYQIEKAIEANSDKPAYNKIYGDKVLADFYAKLDVKPQEKFLDFGCGVGNLYRVISNSFPEQKGNYTGLDVSRVCLECAEKMDGLSIGTNLMEYDGITIPFSDDSFHKAMCFGVFDICNQEQILPEIIRVLAEDGVLLLSGKHCNYRMDDEPAYVAEVNARKKGHPNSFTDVTNMTEQLNAYGVEVIGEYYFCYREDFPQNKFVNEKPEEYYNWILLLKKIKNVHPKKKEFLKFSDFYSKTYQKRV